MANKIRLELKEIQDLLESKGMYTEYKRDMNFDIAGLAVYETKHTRIPVIIDDDGYDFCIRDLRTESYSVTYVTKDDVVKELRKAFKSK